MSRKLWLSIVMIAVGASLLVAAGFAAPSSAAPSSTSKVAKTGGTMNWDLLSDLDYSDPALDYYQPGWQIEYATCTQLLNYPDVNGPKGGQLTPEAAVGFPKVSNGGKTYDFTVKADFTKFSDGSPLTAANYKYELERIADPKMQSPAADLFFSDVVGVEQKLAGKAKSVSGVVVKGNHIIFHLTKAAPDFLARVAMPFMCPVTKNTPVDPNGVNTPAGSGPYYIAARTPEKSITIKRNPYYKGKRPHNVNQINVTIGNTEAATQLRVESGQTDIGFAPSSAYASIAKKYGVNKTQFWALPALGVEYLAFNHDRPLFKGPTAAGNTDLMKAINYALDRHALIVQAGAYSGRRTDQILPPGMPGFKACGCYPTIKPPNLTLAKKLASGHTGNGNAVLYVSNSSRAILWSQVVQFDLKQIGLNVDVKQFTRHVQITKEGTRGEPFDITLEGWIADYPDPFDFINILLSGDAIHASNNNNVAYFNDPTYNQKMRQAALLSGSKRYSTYGSLDVDIMKNAAPWAPIRNFLDRYFLSSRVGCYTWNNVYELDLAALCLK